MLIDTHCHLDFADFDAERDDIVARAHAAGVKQMVTISTRVQKLDTLLAIADKYPSVFCSVGTHPNNAGEELDIQTEDLVRLANSHEKIVAIGEAGLDYFYDTQTPADQKTGLLRHIAAARETGLPLVIHSRSADEDMAEILKAESARFREQKFTQRQHRRGLTTVVGPDQKGGGACQVDSNGQELAEIRDLQVLDLHSLFLVTA